MTCFAKLRRSKHIGCFGMSLESQAGPRLDRRADRANPNLNKKKRKKGKGEKKGKEDVKGISTTSLSQCYQCKKM